MKKALLLMVLTIMSTFTNAQIKTPKPSPFSKVEQMVGLTNFTVEYSRPNVRGRAVFGDLVPYDKLWRTGANSNTTIEFSTPVTVGGKELKKGKYAIFTKPTSNSWEVYFYSDTSNWGTPKKWDETKIAAMIKVDVIKLPMNIETFTIGFDDLTHENVNLGIMWEKTYVGIPIKTPTNKTVLENIEKRMGEPSGTDYYKAAVYLSSTDQDLNKANDYMTKAMSLIENPRFFQLRQQSLILAKLGKKKEAIEVAKKSLEGAKEAGNNDYIKLNKDSLKEWGAK